MQDFFNSELNSFIKMPRLFVGIKIENQPELELLVTELQDKLKNNAINWVPVKNFHITLKFLGEVSSDSIMSISSHLLNLNNTPDHIILKYNKPGFFGSLSSPRVIWFDFKPNSELSILQSTIDNSLAEVGFDLEKKSYSPHLTLARIKKLKEEKIFRDLMNNNKIYNETIDIHEFHLFQSNLKKEGPEYIVLATFKLGNIKT